eukprot:4513907-Pyramimonas_sp.AAC.2
MNVYSAPVATLALPPQRALNVRVPFPYCRHNPTIFKEFFPDWDEERCVGEFPKVLSYVRHTERIADPLVSRFV